MTIGYAFSHFQPILPAILFIKNPFSIRFWPITFANVNHNSVVIKWMSVLFGFLLDTYINIYNIFLKAKGMATKNTTKFGNTGPIANYIFTL